MDIEITLRLSSASFTWKTHKQIALTENLMRIPVQVVFVNVEVGHILLGIPVKACIDHIIEGAIQFIVSKQRSFLLDLLVVVNDLINVNVILAVGIIEDDKLTRNGGHDFFQSDLHCGQKKIRILFWHHHIQAQVILQIFSRHAELHIQTICRQTMYAERIDNLHCHRLICCLRKCTSDNIFQLLACSYNAADGRIALEKAI